MNEVHYQVLAETLGQRGIDVRHVIDRLKRQHIETPSWGYGNSGTRFKMFAWRGAARTIYEKLDDAGYVHRLTGVAPSIAIHIPWDTADDYDALQEYAAQQGVRIGAVNPNLFQDDAYKLGSITHADPGVREDALAHIVDCCAIMGKTGSKLLSLWFADGTNYAGQDNIVQRKRRLEEALRSVYPYMPADARMLIEYKFFEPAFYHTDLADWGMAYATALKVGDRAQVLVDTGHHAQGTNIAHIVAFLLDEGRLGGFHFNARRYADDDLIVGTNNPQELFEIYHELVEAESRADDVAFMIDQTHNIEPKLEAMLLSIVNCQIAFAKALIVDRRTLHQQQMAGDVLGAHGTLMDAYHTDVRPLLERARIEMNVPENPIAAYRADDYAKRIADTRGIAGDGGGFPT
ncbi:MAG: L-rhamnose isomerase [Chloroflexota bacterium]|nr:L-rhamnose isomerase [Chloroflexota bacterium]